MTAHRQNTVVEKPFRWYKPSTWLQRSATYNVGPAKSADYWKGALMGTNKSKVSVTEKTAQGIPALWRAFNIISEQIASLPVSVYSEKDGIIEEAKTHPLYRLLKFRPGPEFSSFDFRETFVRQILMRGESFVHPIRNGAGSVSRFTILPKPVDIFENAAGVLYYKFQFDDSKELLLRFDEVLHFKAYSLDGINGQNPLKIFHEALGIAISQIDYAGSYFGNGAHVSGLLTPESPMKPEQTEQVIKFWNRNNSGPDRVGKTGIIPFGMKYQQLGSNLQDSDYSKSRQLSVEDVANITGVPVDLLNSSDKTSTYASAEQRILQFVNFVIRTHCKRIEDEMNSKLFSTREMGRIFVRFNLSGLLRGDTKTRAAYYNTLLQNGVLSRNEVRSLENMNPKDGADDLLVPMNMQGLTNAIKEEE